MTTISAGHYAAVAATAALVVSLGGTSYAATQIGTAQLRNNAVTSAKIANGQVQGVDVRDRSLTGADVRDDSLTGADVAEQKLGTVPRAGLADEAVRAEDAATVAENRVVRVSDAVDEGPGEPLVVFDSQDLRIALSCTGTGGTRLVATTTRGVGSISTMVVGDSDPAPGQVATADVEDGTFNPGVEFDLLAGGNGDLNQVTFAWAGRIGATATGTLLVNHTGGTSAQCRVSGYVTAYVPVGAF